MSRPMVFEFQGDTTGIEDAASDVVAALDDVDAELAKVEQTGKQTTDSLARDADRAGRRVGDSLEDGFEDGADAAKDMGRDADRSMRDTERQAEKSGDRIGDDLGDGFEKAGDAAGDMASDVGDAIGDVVADAASGGEDIGGSLINGISTAAALIPGLGAGIGTAVAGIAGGVYEAFRENAEKTEQRTSDMYNEMISTGQGYLSYKYIEAEISKMIDEGQIEEIQRKADIAGVSWQEMARAMAGSTTDLETVLGSAGAKVDELQAKIDSNTSTSLHGNSGFIGMRNQVQDVVGELEGVAGSLDTAAAKAQLFADTMAGVPQDPVTVPVEADTAAAEQQIEAVAEDRETTVEAEADTEAAGQSLTSFTSQQRSTSVKVTADTAAADAALFTFMTKPRQITIQAKIVDPRGVEVP